MDRITLGLIAAALGAAVVVLALQNWRAHRDRSRTRAAFFDGCLPLFSHPRVAFDGAGFPLLAGQYRGAAFDIRAVPDTLTYRKLPALWVLVTLPGPFPVSATLDVMMRPSGLESFSNFGRLPELIATPVGFPEGCAVRADRPDGLPPEALLAPHLALFDDPRVKELVVSPKGLRITFLAAEANRTRYLMFRDAEMGSAPLARERLVPLMDRLVALRASLLDARETNLHREIA